MEFCRQLWQFDECWRLSLPDTGWGLFTDKENGTTKIIFPFSKY